MSTMVTIWRMQLRSLRNAVRYDTRMRVALAVGLAFSVVIGLWSAGQLSLRLHQWQMQGPGAVDTGLWLLCWLTWSGMIGLTILSGVLRAWGDDEALVLFSLPLTAATRFRVLFGAFFIENLWAWLLLEVGVTGYVLLSMLGWHALIWLVLLQLGVAVAVLCTQVSMFLMIHYLFPRARRKMRRAVAVGLGLMLVALLLLNLKGTLDVQPLMLWLHPEFVIVLFVLLLVGGLGPLAEPAGRLYGAAFATTQSWDRSRKATTLPGLRVLTGVFARRRTLTGALFVRMLLSQSRSFVAWGRLGMVLIILMLFPQLHAVAAQAGWSDMLFVVGFAAGLALLGVAEQAPSAISGEANRLILYLSAPLALSDLLRAKLLLFVLPILIQGLALALFLAWRFALAPDQVGFALVVTALLVVGTLPLFVWGSAWDEDLSLVVEGATQTILQEETPITPRRMWLLTLGSASFAGMVLLLWKFPPELALTALVVFDAAITAGMWHVGRAQLWRVIRVG
jgi:hypothetical protein